MNGGGDCGEVGGGGEGDGGSGDALYAYISFHLLKIC